MEKQGHFVLVHGACHGAWCWFKVAALLKSAGHKVTALDLAACGVNPKQVHHLKSISDYLEPLMEFMTSLPLEERVILVGHSYGGLGISFAMENFPHKISAAVFVAATMPGPDFTYTTIREEFSRRIDFMDSQIIFDDGANNPPTSRLLGPNCLSSRFYQLSSTKDFTLAMMLIRPFPLFSNASVEAEAVFTEDKFGSIPRIYIVCDQDNMVNEDLQRWMIQNNPPDEVKVVPDSDHMVMISQPQVFCSCLEEIAKKYFYSALCSRGRTCEYCRTKII